MANTEIDTDYLLKLFNIPNPNSKCASIPASPSPSAQSENSIECNQNTNDTVVSSDEDSEQELTNLTWLTQLKNLAAWPDSVNPTLLVDDEEDIIIHNNNKLPKGVTNVLKKDTAADRFNKFIDQVVKSRTDYDASAELFQSNSEVKPTFNYAQIIAMAMHENGRMTLQQICSWIERKFAYFRARKNWNNSIRHNLSLHCCFRKIDRSKYEKGKGGYWELGIDITKCERKRVRNRKTRSSSSSGGGSATNNNNNNNNALINKDSSSLDAMDNNNICLNRKRIRIDINNETISSSLLHSSNNYSNGSNNNLDMINLSTITNTTTDDDDDVIQDIFYQNDLREFNLETNFVDVNTVIEQTFHDIENHDEIYNNNHSHHHQHQHQHHLNDKNFTTIVTTDDNGNLNTSSIIIETDGIASHNDDHCNTIVTGDVASIMTATSETITTDAAGVEETTKSATIQQQQQNCLNHSTNNDANDTADAAAVAAVASTIEILEENFRNGTIIDPTTINVQNSEIFLANEVPQPSENVVISILNNHPCDGPNVIVEPIPYATLSSALDDSYKPYFDGIDEEFQFLRNCENRDDLIIDSLYDIATNDF